MQGVWFLGIKLLAEWRREERKRWKKEEKRKKKEEKQADRKERRNNLHSLSASHVSHGPWVVFEEMELCGRKHLRVPVMFLHCAWPQFPLQSAELLGRRSLALMHIVKVHTVMKYMWYISKIKELTERRCFRRVFTILQHLHAARHTGVHTVTDRGIKQCSFRVSLNIDKWLMQRRKDAHQSFLAITGSCLCGCGSVLHSP